MNRRLVLIAVPIIGIVAAGAWLVAGERINVPRPPPAAAVRTAANDETHEATLYCDFYNFMHNGTVVSFYFSADFKDRALPRFTELYVIEPDGTKTSFDGTQAPQPAWAFALDDGTPTITAPDGATRIVLFGYQPKASGIIWTDAGVRSDTYKNLDGKCRQAYFGKTPS